MKCEIGEKKVKERKNPTQVPVHNIQEINSDTNLKNGLVKIHPSLVPAVLILFLNPLKIDPYTKIVVIPYATIIQINNSIIFYCLNLIP